MDITIIDYGLGNLASVYNTLRFLGVRPKISKRSADIKKADKLVLPGVGAFRDAMDGLKKENLIGPIKEFLNSGRTYLGICLGLQVLFEKSDEGGTAGLGIFKGTVRRFLKKDGIKIPHIGWNTVKVRSGDCAQRLTAGINNNSFFYFDHSYYANPEDKNIIAAITDYGTDFPSLICRGNIYAVQFHPERSQGLGLAMLKNFIKL